MIDGIYYVIDPGFVKQNAYDPKLGMDSLIVTPISQAQAKKCDGDGDAHCDVSMTRAGTFLFSGHALFLPKSVDAIAA